jgi:hypothetical protein
VVTRMDLRHQPRLLNRPYVVEIVMGLSRESSFLPSCSLEREGAILLSKDPGFLPPFSLREDAVVLSKNSGFSPSYFQREEAVVFSKRSGFLPSCS